MNAPVNLLARLLALPPSTAPIAKTKWVAPKVAPSAVPEPDGDEGADDATDGGTDDEDSAPKKPILDLIAENEDRRQAAKLARLATRPAANTVTAPQAPLAPPAPGHLPSRDAIWPATDSEQSIAEKIAKFFGPRLTHQDKLLFIDGQPGERDLERLVRSLDGVNPRLDTGRRVRVDARLVDGVLRALRVTLPDVPDASGTSSGFALEQFDLTEEPEPIEWAVRNIFGTDSVNGLVAKPGSLKTWTMLSMGLALATGQPWLGVYPVRQCNVLFVDWESGKTRAHRRLQILAKKHPADNLFYLRSPGNMQDPHFWTMLRSTIAANNIGAVLYDSLGHGSNGVDENSKEAAFGLIEAGKIDGVTHIFVHHAGKGEHKKNEVSRGHSAIQAAFDTIYEFEDPSGSQADALTCNMKLAKAGDGEQVDTIPLRLTDAGGLQFDAEVTKPRDDQLSTAILELLRTGGQKNGTEITMALKKRNAAVRSELSTLSKDGYIVSIDNKYRLDNREHRYGRVLVAIAEGHRIAPVLRQQAHVTDEHLSGFVRDGLLGRYKNEFSQPVKYPGVPVEDLGLTAGDLAKVKEILTF